MDFGTRARDYLHSRGLRDETLHAWHIGFSRPLLIGHNGQRGQVIAGRWVPAGILLPWFDAGEIYEIKIRLPKRKPSANTRPDRAPKYAKVAGGDPVLFGSDHFAGWKQVVLAEGEFDAMLLWQEAGDLVDVASLGSASQQLEDRAVAKLLRYPTILTAYDRDGAGNTANERVGALSARMRQIAVPLGNDITDFWKLEGRLHDWIAFELARLEALQRSGSRPSEKLKNVIETQTIRRQAGPSPEPTVQDVGSEDSEDECHVSAAELAIEQAAKGALRNELAALGEGAVRIRVCQELSVLARHRCWRRLELNAGAYEVGAGCLVIPQGKEAWMAFLERASPLQIVAIRHYFASCSPAWPSTAG